MPSTWELTQQQRRAILKPWIKKTLLCCETKGRKVMREVLESCFGSYLIRWCEQALYSQCWKIDMAQTRNNYAYI